MSRSRLPLILGVGAVSGVGYYVYQAGGDRKAAENKFESDAHRAAADIKSHLPGQSKTNAESDLKGIGAQAGAKVDSVISEADKQASIARSNAEAYAKDAKAETLKAVDKFDHKVEEGAAKAKGGVMGWFGGSK
ncbi:hypothetical protein B0T10DRAFT_311305 [Thelonectria olida]|uniref:Calcofluor white hypersensitive protein n=1 Tax=Thelonectria olida TaxID=1576542 RepID=A0A9P8W708_9HYPO|nr:hypothetical protein B0T10DRAFT_311305 [Thelonectria olida]